MEEVEGVEERVKEEEVEGWWRRWMKGVVEEEEVEKEKEDSLQEL